MANIKDKGGRCSGFQKKTSLSASPRLRGEAVASFSRVDSRVKVFLVSFPLVAFKKPKQTLNESALYDYAIGALTRKMRTIAELKRLLRRRCPDDATVSSVIIRLKDHKYLSDSAYAATYAALRRDNQKFGSRRVITDLKVKGVHSDVIEKAVTEAYGNTDELTQARAFLKRKRLSKPATNQEVARIFRTLMRAGFGVSASIRVLKNWEVDDEVLTALQEESDH